MTGTQPTTTARTSDAQPAELMLSDIFRDAQSESAEPRRVPAKTARRRRRVWLGLLVSVLAVVLGSLSFVIGRAHVLLSGIERDSSLLPVRGPGQSVAPAQPGEPVDFVIMGSDSRGEDRGRSDVLLVAHLTADRDKLYLISFPRDLYVEIPGHGENKINAAYAFGGAALAVETLEELLDFDVEHAALIDFESFISLSEVVGGVSIDNRIESSSNGFSFPEGDIRLEGDALLAYVRQRHGLPNGDLDRAERQRVVLKAMVRKLATPAILSNPVTFAELTGEVGQCVIVDANLTDSTIWQLASSLRLGGGEDIVTFQAPITGFGRSPEGASIDIVDEKAMAELGKALAGDSVDDYLAQYHDEFGD